MEWVRLHTARCAGDSLSLYEKERAHGGAVDRQRCVRLRIGRVRRRRDRRALDGAAVDGNAHGVPDKRAVGLANGLPLDAVPNAIPDELAERAAEHGGRSNVRRVVRGGTELAVL